MSINDISDTKRKIILASERLFRDYGYDGTSMRMLADACGMAVGNLCYYFPKKEDLIMVDHNILMDAFLTNLAAVEQPEDPWLFDIAAEWEFLLRLYEDADLLPLYREVINVPALRQDYYQKHHELLQRFFSAADFGVSEREFYQSTVAFCSLCFQMLEQYDGVHRDALEEALVKVFRTRFFFLGLDDAAMEPTIRQGLALARETFNKVSNKELFYGLEASAEVQ
ncbi:MAG: TetR/AcrR family transcriptional regulator [Clostridia bacterium]|nr:TetR/AcrR family transcriptional regulator [Clostridia bacterium]